MPRFTHFYSYLHSVACGWGGTSVNLICFVNSGYSSISILFHQSFTPLQIHGYCVMLWRCVSAAESSLQSAQLMEHRRICCWSGTGFNHHWMRAESKVNSLVLLSAPLVSLVKQQTLIKALHDIITIPAVWLASSSPIYGSLLRLILRVDFIGNFLYWWISDVYILARNLGNILEHAIIYKQRKNRAH